ncbi:hypothetical protein [Variovorax sp. Root473]|uniref:hypothetical protein n=1 Tax=Variovorax sp. Root473 TaxID=1736541 RepID=UPI0012FBAA8F|nr:hypothetical protein [Variovorax sp. Root473]
MSARFPGTPDETNVWLKDKWRPPSMYELVDIAKAPKAMGLGLAALRRLVRVPARPR